jgi:ferredoxin
LIAVGLNPVDEFTEKAKEVGLTVFAAGDTAEIAEASAAMFSGKIAGIEIAQFMGKEGLSIPDEWRSFEAILKSKPGEIHPLDESHPSGKVFPVMHCRQEIPCDPCATVCPNNLIRINPDDIRNLPEFCTYDEKNCIACERCVAICPGLAITLVDFRKSLHSPVVSIPMEFSKQYLPVGDQVPVTDIDGNILGKYPVISTRQLRQFPRTLIVRVQVPAKIATIVSGIQLHAGWNEEVTQTDHYLEETEQETIVCRCEHISADDIRALVRHGVRDINQIKAVTKATMGSCGGKTCLALIKKIFREEGIPINEVTDPTQRPVFVEIPLETLARNQQEEL